MSLTENTISNSEERILATFFLMTYNQEEYIREAIEGAFSQTYSPLEIVISDDCSTDRTFSIIEEMCASYQGKHKVIINKNQKNLGLIGHINSITSRSSGELIVYAAGDDISLPERTEELVKRYLATKCKATLIHSSVYLIDNKGNKVGTRLPPIISGGLDMNGIASSGALIIGATSAFTRKIEEIFGPITNNKCIEDLVMGFRSALIGGFEYIDQPLILYRHESGITAKPDIRTQSYKKWIHREIRNQDIFLAILSQRIADVKKVNNKELLPIIVHERTKPLLRRKILMGKYSLIRMLSFCAKRRLMGFFLSFLLRKGKKQLFFLIKDFVYK